MLTNNISQCQSLKISVILEHPSIRRLLQQQFFNAWKDAFSPPDTTQVQLESIPLYRLKQPKKIVYRCSAAWRLASLYQLSPISIAQRLLGHLISCNLPLQEPSLDFKLQLGEKGVIDCILDDCSLLVWLERFPELFLSVFPAREAAQVNSSLNIFPLQYTHARCCSLLRLGDLDGLIQFHTEQLEQAKWLWKAPKPIPWQILPKGYEFALINQILNLVDDIEDVAPKNYLILAKGLCAAFWDLERYCRILGEVKEKNPDLAQARLGLVALTQLVLRGLLQEKFKVTVCVEM